MSKRIYVGNLPWSVTKDRLEDLFSSFGEIEEALVVANKYTGRSRGFGFVTFKKDEAADEAIAKMDGKEVEGRNLVVKEARPLEERRPEERGSHFRERMPRENSSGERQDVVRKHGQVGERTPKRGHSGERTPKGRRRREEFEG